MKRLTAALFLAAIIAGPAALAQDFPEFTNYVVDVADVVADADEQQLDAALGIYERESGNQIAVAVIETLADNNIEDYSNDLFEAWGIGDATKDNGVLLLIAMEERQMRIEVGFGLEGDLTDLESGRIIRDVIAPLMREGDVGVAVTSGASAIAQAIGGEPLPGVRVEQPQFAEPELGSRGIGSLFWVIPFLIFGPLSALGRRGRHRRGWITPILWGGLGGLSGGGFRGGSSGGGFGGGGFGG
ncbi:MAG: TPM domain-containing protein, partial [Actinomycetota bacterium]